MEDNGWQVLHGQTALAGTVEMLSLSDRQRAEIFFIEDPWEVMIRFYHGVMTDIEFGVGILPRMMEIPHLQCSTLVDLAGELSEILSSEIRDFRPWELKKRRGITAIAVEACKTNTAEHWYARALMSLCEVLATAGEEDHGQKAGHAQRIIVFLRSAARVKAVQAQEPPAEAERHMQQSLVALLLQVCKSVRPAAATDDGWL